mmetsp:Transcript_6774/g.11532  ORF Transcript_6774/g.11532 Transcript_6774/m.11532 type:complete len:238 (-) Transcript_6774:1349-2062(-)
MAYWSNILCHSERKYPDYPEFLYVTNVASDVVSDVASDVERGCKNDVTTDCQVGVLYVLCQQRIAHHTCRRCQLLQEFVQAARGPNDAALIDICHVADLCKAGTLGPGIHDVHQERPEALHVLIGVHLQLALPGHFRNVAGSVLQLAERLCHGLSEFDDLPTLFHWDETGHQGHQLWSTQSDECAVEHELCGHQLICSVHLTGGSPLQQHHTIFVHVAQPAEHVCALLGLLLELRQL